jgi:folate-dependent tRNA-U54 methylase TrmFO/GidA
MLARSARGICRSSRGVAAQGGGRTFVVGARLAGCEAAWQLARRGLDVVTHEIARAPLGAFLARLAELVCKNAAGDQGSQCRKLLKEEMCAARRW